MCLHSVCSWAYWVGLLMLTVQHCNSHRLIKTQIGHARDFAWYRGQRPSPARMILSHERVQIHVSENLCSYATNPPHFRVRELLLCDILITRAGDGHWPRYQAKSPACPGCGNSYIVYTVCTISSWQWHQCALRARRCISFTRMRKCSVGLGLGTCIFW